MLLFLVLVQYLLVTRWVQTKNRSVSFKKKKIIFTKTFLFIVRIFLKWHPNQYDTNQGLHILSISFYRNMEVVLCFCCVFRGFWNPFIVEYHKLEHLFQLMRFTEQTDFTLKSFIILIAVTFVFFLFNISVRPVSFTDCFLSVTLVMRLFLSE